jgi:hypothetical protein
VRRDRLPAIAGLAKKFALRSPGAYLAGHWQGDIFRSLCWTVDDDDENHHIGGAKATQAVSGSPGSCYYAPSWSWASTETKKSVSEDLWNAWRGGSRSSRLEAMELAHWMERYCPSFVSAAVTPLHGDPYMSVDGSSYIEIDGFCRDVFVVLGGLHNDPDATVTSLEEVCFDDPSINSSVAWFYTRRPPSRWSEPKLVTICQVWKEVRGERLVHALILHEDRSGEYRRMGICKLGGYNLGRYRPGGHQNQPANFPVVYFWHPDRISSSRYRQLVHGRDWELRRWEKRRLKIF